MTVGTMHEGEVALNPGLVRRLITGQFPQWSELEISPLPSSGTVNAVYRLGDQMCIRLPRLEYGVATLEKERHWLPILAANLELAIPKPLQKGAPTTDYPFSWSIYRWLTGEDFAIEQVTDELDAAKSLANFISDLRQVEISSAPCSSRDRPLLTRDEETREAIESIKDIVDAAAVTAIWEKCLTAAVWDGVPVWTHGDLLPPNLLIENGKLKAVIDFGNMGVGDPAVDVIAAWSIFTKDSRRAFKTALNIDEDSWLRSCGMALHQAVLIIPYYPETNPAFVTMALRTLNEILADKLH